MKVLKIGIGIFLLVAVIAGVLVYNNLNRLLSDALMKSFNSNLASDVYELKFEDLRLDLLQGSIQVYKVSILPREKPLNSYPYINSSFRLTTDHLTLKHVQILQLLNSNKLLLDKISIEKPDFSLLLSGKLNIFMPFKDSTATPKSETKKRPIDSFSLDEFDLIDATFHVTNLGKDREFRIEKLNIALNHLMIRQRPSTDLIAFKSVVLSIGEFYGNLRKTAVKRIEFKDFKIGIDSLDLKLTPDTAIFHFVDFTAQVRALDAQTRDSIFHLTLQSFDISYRDKSITLKDLSFTPNISDSVMQTRFAYQHTSASGKVSAVIFKNVNFDSLIYHHGFFVGEILIDKPEVNVFKDNTKPVDPDHFPGYFGQQIGTVPIPLLIKSVKATQVTLFNTERKRDSTFAKVSIQRGTAEVSNITNLSSKKPLVLRAGAYINNQVPFNLQLDFDYTRPQFKVDGKFGKFTLTDLSPVIQAYTPAKVIGGTADEISFSGMIYKTYSEGTMKFLYHDLKVDMELKTKAKWKSSVLAFAANTYLHASNPGSNLPPRIVKYHVDRDMHKGFINIVIKSALMGVKETMIMSKQNKQDFKQAKKQYKKENK